MNISEHSSPTEEHRPRASGRKRLVRAAAYGLAGLFTLLLLSYVGPIQKGVVQMLVRTLNPYPDLEISVDDTDGSLFGKLELRGFSASLPGNEPFIVLDTVSIHFGLFELLGSKSLESVELSGATFTIAQQPDGEWPVPVSSATGNEPTNLAIRSIRIRNMSGKAIFWPPEADSVWSLDRFHADINNLRMDGAISAELDTIRASFSPAGVPYSVDLGLGATILDNRVGDLFAELHSERSDVSASGTLVIPRDQGSMEEIILQIDADPLAFSDIRAFVPVVHPEAELQISGRLAGRWDSLSFDVSAELPGDGTVTATGRFETDEETSILVVESDVSMFDPSRLLRGNDIPQGSISAHLTANLSGPSPDSLFGAVYARAEDAKLGTQNIELLKFEQHFDSGKGNFILDTRLASGLMHAEGWIRVFDTTPTWVIDGIIDDVDLASLLHFDNLPVRLSGRVGSTRETVSRDSTRTTAFLDFGDSSVGRCPLSTGRIDLESSVGNGWSGEGSIQSCESSNIFFRGEIDSDYSWSATASLERVDIAGFLNDSLHSSISGDARFSGTLADSGNDSTEGIISLSHLRYGTLQADLATLEWKSTAQESAVHLMARSGSGVIQGDILVSTVDEGRQIDLGNFRFEEIDAAAWDQSIGLPSSLSGTFSGSFISRADGTLAGDGTVVLASSRIQSGDITGGSMSLNVSSGGVAFDAEIQTGNDIEERYGPAPEPLIAMEPDKETGSGAGTLSLSGVLVSETDSWQLEDLKGSFQMLDLGPWFGSQKTSTRISGSIAGSGDLSFGSCSIIIDSTSTINRLSVDTLTLYAELNQDQLKTHLSGSASGGTLDIHATAFLISPFTVEASTAGRDLDFAAVAGLDSTPSSTSFAGTVSGSGLSFDSATWSVSIDSLSARWGDLRVSDFTTDITYESGWLRIDTLSMVGSPGRLTGAGVALLDPALHDAADESDFQFSLKAGDSDGLGPLALQLPIGWSELELNGRLTGPPAGRRAEILGELQGVRAADLRISGISSTVLAEIDEKNAISAAEMRSDLQVLSFSGVRSESIDIDVSFDGSNIYTTTNVTVDESRSLQSIVVVDPFQKPYDLELDQLSAVLEGEEWRLLAPARIVLREVPEITGVYLISENGRIAVNSNRTEPNALSTFVSVDNFPIDSVSDLFGYSNLGGEMDGLLNIQQVDSITTVNGTLRAILTSFGEASGELDSSLSFRDGQVGIEGSLVRADGRRALISGLLPFPIDDTREENPVRIRIQAEQFSVDGLLPFFDPLLVDHLAGRFSSDIVVSGTWDQPFVTGTMALVDGSIGIPKLGGQRGGLRFTNAGVSLAFAGDSVRVDNLEARSGGGWFRGEGSIAIEALSLGQYAIDLRADDFLAIDNSQYRSVIEGDFRLTGTTRAPRLDGTANILSADFYLTEDITADAFEPVTLSPFDIRTIERRFGIQVTESDTTTFDIYRSLTIGNLTATLERDSWLRSKSNPRMDIQFTGDLDITKKSGSNSEVFGSIDVLPERSRIVQFGRRFDLSRGSLTFNGPAEQPVMDIEAQYSVKSRGSQEDEVTIRLLATGDVDLLDVTFESDPTMELADIVSYIATGRPASESLQIGTAQNQNYMRSAAGLAIGPVTDLIENLASAGLGLDVIEIDHNGLQGVTLTAGKYVSPRLYVAISQPISFSNNADKTGSGNENHTQVAMEYELVRQLLLSLMNRGTILRTDLRWEYAF